MILTAQKPKLVCRAISKFPTATCSFEKRSVLCGPLLVYYLFPSWIWRLMWSLGWTMHRKCTTNLYKFISVSLKAVFIKYFTLYAGICNQYCIIIRAIVGYIYWLYGCYTISKGSAPREIFVRILDSEQCQKANGLRWCVFSTFFIRILYAHTTMPIKVTRSFIRIHFNIKRFVLLVPGTFRKILR